MQIQTPEQLAIAAALQSHEKIIYKFCNFYFRSKHDRQDVYQAVAEKICRSFSGFTGASTISTWIFAITRNTVLDIVRKRKKEPKMVAFTGAITDMEADTTSLDRIKFEAREFDRLLGLLNEQDQHLTCLYILGESYRRIGTLMGIEENMARVRIHRIKKYMKKHANINVC